MFDIEVRNGEIKIGEEAMKPFREARKLDLKMKKNEIEMAKFKEALMQAMRENGVKAVDTEVMKAVYIPEHQTERLDAKALKADHPKIAKQYMKSSTTKESLRLTYK